MASGSAPDVARVKQLKTVMEHQRYTLERKRRERSLTRQDYTD
ncbi:hypothetical protein [Paenibacillus xylanexedens]|nr:hypothetical protein [Paenibacillus xylanexedens]